MSSTWMEMWSSTWASCHRRTRDASGGDRTAVGDGRQEVCRGARSSVDVEQAAGCGRRPGARDRGVPPPAAQVDAAADGLLRDGQDVAEVLLALGLVRGRDADAGGEEGPVRARPGGWAQGRGDAPRPPE